MPNHCENDLVIECHVPSLMEYVLKTYFPDGKFSLDSVMPYPAHFREMDKRAAEWKPEDGGKRPTDGFNSGGYEWCCDNWGTKWDAYDHTELLVSDDKTKIMQSFQTAWSPPVKVIEHIAATHPALKVHLDGYECGMGFAFHGKWEYGEATENITKPYGGSRGG